MISITIIAEGTHGHNVSIYFREKTPAIQFRWYRKVMYVQIDLEAIELNQDHCSQCIRNNFIIMSDEHRLC